MSGLRLSKDFVKVCKPFWAHGQWAPHCRLTKRLTSTQSIGAKGKSVKDLCGPEKHLKGQSGQPSVFSVCSLSERDGTRSKPAKATLFIRSLAHRAAVARPVHAPKKTGGSVREPPPPCRPENGQCTASSAAWPRARCGCSRRRRNPRGAGWGARCASRSCVCVSVVAWLECIHPL